MRIGIVPELHGYSGGVYQYSLSMLDALSQWIAAYPNHEVVVFTHSAQRSLLTSRYRGPWNIEPYQPLSLKRLARDLLGPVGGVDRLRRVWHWIRQRHGSFQNRLDPDLVRPRPHMARWFRRFSIELMIYPAPSPLSFETGLPFIMAVHDLQHRLQPMFPEVSANGEWERREYLFRNAARRATILLADSEVGKEDILNFYGEYGVRSDMIKVLPFVPPSYTREAPEAELREIRFRYRLPKKYLFYPSQFWPHKNHFRIVQALAFLKKEHGLAVPMVFSGSYSDEIRAKTFNSTMKLSHELGLGEQVIVLGYVPDRDMSALYTGATGLLMPTFFGPTNIPVLEAWVCGCPVITSDIRGIREQVGDAGLLVDPTCVEDMARAIHRVWRDEELRLELARLGRQRLTAFTTNEYQQRFNQVINEAILRVQSPPQRNSVALHQQDGTQWLL